MKYIIRRKISWCAIEYEIVPFKEIIQEHYREKAFKTIQMKGGAD